MNAKSKTVIRNAKIVGNNSKSYDDKHPENPVSLRPIHDAIESLPRVLDKHKRLVPDFEKIRFLRSCGGLPRMDIAAIILRV